MADSDPDRVIAAWRLARYEARLKAAVVAALAEQRRGLSIRPGSPSGDPWDSATWPDTVREYVEPVAASILAEVYENVAKSVGMSDALAATRDQLIADQLTGIVQMATDLGNELGPRIAKAAVNSMHVSQLNDTIGKIFTGADGSSDRVARTVSGFANGLAVQAGTSVHGETPMQKTWVATNDDRTREDHAEADGQTVPVDEPFEVGGEQAMYPGDPSLSDAELLNCRCWVSVSPAQGVTASASVTDDAASGHTPDVPAVTIGTLSAKAPAPRAPNRAERRRHEQALRRQIRKATR